MVGPKRAVGAPLAVPRAEHEMVDDELALAREQLRKRLLPVRAVKDVVLPDPRPGQGAPPLFQPVVQPHELLLLDEELLARREPFLRRNDLVILRACPGGELGHDVLRFSGLWCGFSLESPAMSSAR